MDVNTLLYDPVFQQNKLKVTFVLYVDSTATCNAKSKGLGFDMYLVHNKSFR